MVFSGLAGCAHTPDAAPPAPSPAAPVSTPEPAPPPEDELTLERTACSGACPVYTLAIHRDGRVHFVGVRDVAAEGARDWRMEPMYARHLFSEVERSGFLALGPRYPTEVEEFPGLVLTLRKDGAVHRVQLGGEGSAELARDLAAEQMLTRLGVLIDKLTASGRFVDVGSKKKSGSCVEP
jgi:hypothetical protein